MSTFLGKCFCGAIKFYLDGDPFFTQYCHCNKCREVLSQSQRDEDKLGYAWTAGCLTKHFHITAGAENLTALIRNNATLFLCEFCRSLIYGISLDVNKQAGIGVNMNNFVFANGLPDSFKAVRHIWYVDRIVDFQDGLPKFVDAPMEQFGSGKLF